MHTVRVSAMRLSVVSSTQRAPDPASAAGRDLAGLGSSRPVPPDSSGLSHVLLVTTAVRVIHRVHGHTSHDGPLVSFSLHMIHRQYQASEQVQGKLNGRLPCTCGRLCRP